MLRERFDFSRESWLAEHLVADFNTRMETFEAQAGIQRVHPGEVLVSYHKQVPVIVTLHTLPELAVFDDPHLNLAMVNRTHQQMIARMATEAYLQSALLSTFDRGFLVMRQQRTVADLITAYEQEHDLVLPTPGSVHDAGRKLTHKRRIIQLHLQGMLNQRSRG